MKGSMPKLLLFTLLLVVTFAAERMEYVYFPLEKTWQEIIEFKTGRRRVGWRIV